MAKIKNLFFLTIPLWMIFIACTSDMTYRLGDGYVYHNEGGALKRIYCTKAKCDVYIPPTILSYSYNSTYILAKQKLKLPSLAIEPDYSYNFANSKDSIFYWIINKRENHLYGPLSMREFNVLVDSLQLGDKSKLYCAIKR
ncbi:MAG: DUF3997 domain-containing protein [Bacteroidales bacterium]|nr:DUF3997 domain-containing protein [Bacteroidales bacterium]